MALVRAEPLDGLPLPELSGTGPHSCAELAAWCGRRFTLPPGDPVLADLHAGGAAPRPAWDNLVGAHRAWEMTPDWMDQLDPGSPVHRDKRMERALYLDAWSEHVSPGARVLDVGGGVGRFAQWLLSLGCSVDLVDPDLRSLWCAMDRLAGGPGALDLHWSTGSALGEIAPVDVALSVEVLCYVSDPGAVLTEIRRVLKPGGLLLLSVEATGGAAKAREAPDMDASGVMHVPGDRWVQTYTEASLRALLSGWEVLSLQPSHYVLSGPLEAQAADLGLEGIRELERTAKADPQTRGLNRAWCAVVR